MMRTRCAVLLLLLATPALAEDQPPGDPSEPQWRRELAGHVFIPSLVVTDPFTSTNFSINTLAGYSWITGPGFDIRGDEIGRASYVAEALGEAVSFQASLARWLALRLSGGGGLNGGSGGRSALVVGAVAPILLGVGATASWKLGRIFRLGGTVDFVYSYSKLIQPLSAVQASLTENQVDTAQLSQRINGYSVTPGASLAIAPIRAIGLIASAQYLWNGLYGDVSSASLSYIVLGASGQLDLRPICALVPIAFLLSYRAQIPLQSHTRYAHALEGGLFYTGRHAIDLGVEAQLKWFDLRPDTRLELDTLQLTVSVLLRYHWN
jgi:hypothetical protein